MFSFLNRPLKCDSKVLVAFAMAIALQIQLTLFTDGQYLGLRVALSDLLLPIAGLIAAWHVISKQSPFPQWFAKHLNLLLAIATALFIWATYLGYNHIGALDKWALVNRMGGWLVVMAYFFLAGWCAPRLDHTNLKRFAAIACGFGFAVIAANTVWLFGTDPMGRQYWRLENYPAAGFMVNRNALAFVLCCLLAMWGTARRHGIELIPDRWMQAFIFLLPFIWSYNGSRAGALVCLLLGVIAVVGMPRIIWRRFALPLAVGLALCLTLYLNNPFAIMREAQMANLTNVQEFMGLRDEAPPRKVVHDFYPDVENAPATDIQNKSDQLRVIVWHDAMEMWKKSPLFGIGIGSFLYNQQQKYAGYLDQIDCTPLWLLTEMGAVSLVFFGGLYLFLVWQLGLRAYRQCRGTSRWFYQSCLLVLLIFGLFSLVHQMMFARHLWFLLGLAFSFDVQRLPKQDSAA